MDCFVLILLPNSCEKLRSYIHQINEWLSFENKTKILDNWVRAKQKLEWAPNLRAGVTKM